MLRTMLPAIMVLVTFTAPGVAAQRPAPFPTPGGAPPQPSTEAPKPRTPAPPTAAMAAAPQTSGAPDEATLGVPIFAGAQFIRSFDAGRGQRYYLFGSNATFLDVVNFYKAALKQKGELVYDQPPIHEFDVGRFREETMAFPPGVTVKDYASGGGQGYLNPKRGGEPASFRTIIQIVPGGQ